MHSHVILGPMMAWLSVCRAASNSECRQVGYIGLEQAFMVEIRLLRVLILLSLAGCIQHSARHQTKVYTYYKSRWFCAAI